MAKAAKDLGQKEPSNRKDTPSAPTRAEHPTFAREELQRILEKCRFLLEGKQNLMIFPEGGRSRTGRVDQENFSYGVGRFLDECSRCRVVLVYLRGDHQQEYGTIPRFGENFTMNVEVFDPGKVAGGGLRYQREYARRVVERLAMMEESWFASRG